MITGASRQGRRGRRHLLVAGFVLAYLAAGGVTLALGDRVIGGCWLALYLVLLGAASNAIVVWSEHFAAALLHAAPTRAGATARALALNLGILAVLGGVHTGRVALAAARACLVGAVVLAPAVALTTPTPLRQPQPLGPVTPAHQQAATHKVTASSTFPVWSWSSSSSQSHARGSGVEHQYPHRSGPGPARCSWRLSGVVSLHMTMSNG
jgi:hypothetical protein